MVHAKMLLFDRGLAVTGSPNLDMRSIYLNFEIALFHQSPAEIDAAETWIRRLIQDAAPLDLARPSALRSWAEGLATLTAPML